MVALAVTATIVAASVALTPTWWTDWLAVLRDGQSVPAGTPGWFLPVPLWVRLPAAGALLAWGAWGDRRWTVPLVMVLAMPVLWLNSLAVLVALVPLARIGRDGARPGGPPRPHAT
jgi:hypothetical protein